MCLVAFPLARQWLQDCWPCAGEPPFAGLCANVPAKDGPVQKRYLPIIVLVLAAAVVALVGYNLPDNAPPVPERVLLDNASGKVVFDHKLHSGVLQLKCVQCHHENPTPRENVQPCRTCHGPEFNAAFRTTHTVAITDTASCVTCHHMEYKRKDWGHKKHVEEHGLACTECHHGKEVEPEPHGCTDCHDAKGDKGMPALKAAVHAKCRTCHEEKFAAQNPRKPAGCADCHTLVPGRERLLASERAGSSAFHVNEAYAHCAVCHEGAKPQDLVPGRMAAYHGQCITCHEKRGKGPFTKDQCNQCHTR